MVHKLIYAELASRGWGALFLDRDGVINGEPPEHDYVKHWGEFILHETAFPLVKWANQLSLPVIFVTNQRGIARRLMNHDRFHEITDQMVQVLSNNGLEVNAVYYCPHDYIDRCECRKPAPGMFLAAQMDFRLNLARSVMIGNSKNDILAAKAAGVGTTIQIPTNYPGHAMQILNRLSL